MGIQINGNTNNINAGIGSLSIEDINELHIIGVATASNFKTGTSNLHSTGLNIFDLDADGHTELDDVRIAGVATFYQGGSEVVRINSGGLLLYNDLSFFGASTHAYWDRSANQFLLNDNTKLSVGSSSDLSIYHDGSHSIIQNGTGDLRISGNRLELRSYTGGENYLTGDYNSAVKLYHNNIQKLETASDGVIITGICTATSFSGSGANLTGIPAGLGTALSSTQTSPLNKLYYTDRVLSIGSTVTIDHPASATGAYTHYADIQVEDNADLIVADGDDLIPDILGLGGNGTTGAGGAGRLLVDNIVNRSGTGAPTLPNGAVVTGVCTATTFSGSGANLTSLPAAQLTGALPAISGANLTGISAGVVKAAVRRYYGFLQVTGISNSSFTQINQAYVDIVPTSASNYIKLGGLFTWDGSDTEPTYSFRWKKVISGGSTTSIDSSQGQGNRVGITYKVSGNGGLACMNLDSIYDLAGTTSSIRYYLEVFVDGSGQTLWVNRTHADLNDPRDERGASYFIAEEINNSIFTFTNDN